MVFDLPVIIGKGTVIIFLISGVGAWGQESPQKPRVPMTLVARIGRRGFQAPSEPPAPPVVRAPRVETVA